VAVGNCRQLMLEVRLVCAS